MIFTMDDVIYAPVQPPVLDVPNAPGHISDATFRARHARVLEAMQSRGLDALILYADREHGANFSYLCGFAPRFEEACLVLQASGEACALLGNENLKMQAYSRLPMRAVHTPAFSLPNQPVAGWKPLSDAFAEAGIGKGMRCGVAGWKMFPADLGVTAMFDVPHFIVEGIREAAAPGQLVSAAALLIDPTDGVRTTARPDEIAHYEFAAATASNCVFRVLERVKPGVTERELAGELNAFGMPLSCYSMCATGERFTHAVVYPRDKAVRLGDRFTTSMGLAGGLTCRAGYVAESARDLPEDAPEWMDRVARPYFAASATWYSTVGVGVTGGAVYRAVEACIPKGDCSLKLNPGHLIAEEEWMSSPFYSDSPIALRSGMILQMDILLAVQGYAGINAEDGVLLADAELRAALADEFPQVMRRMLRRREYMRAELGIPMGEDVLPMSNTAGYLRPLLLNRGRVLRIRETAEV